MDPQIHSPRFGSHRPSDSRSSTGSRRALACVCPTRRQRRSPRRQRASGRTRPIPRAAAEAEVNGRRLLVVPPDEVGVLRRPSMLPEPEVQCEGTFKDPAPRCRHGQARKQAFEDYGLPEPDEGLSAPASLAGTSVAAAFPGVRGMSQRPTCWPFANLRPRSGPALGGFVRQLKGQASASWISRRSTLRSYESDFRVANPRRVLCPRYRSTSSLARSTSCRAQ
jgi:hypothetical protein